MEIRSTRSFHAIPATIIRGVFNLHVSNLLFKMYCKYLIYIFIHFFLFLPLQIFQIHGKCILTYLKGLCKAKCLHLRRAEKSKNSPIEIDGPHMLLIIHSYRKNAVFVYFLCSIYREAYLPLHTPFKAA